MLDPKNAQLVLAAALPSEHLASEAAELASDLATGSLTSDHLRSYLYIAAGALEADPPVDRSEVASFLLDLINSGL